MSERIRKYFLAVSPEIHLMIALFAGFIFRASSAWFVFGAQALDDYRHGLLPAYEHWAGLETSLPDYRSPLLTWVLSGILSFGEWFGIDQPVEQARWVYFILGLFSLFAIYGAYRLTRNSEHPIWCPLATYLVALHGVLPFLSTRAFGESVSMTFVLLALSFLLAEPRRLTLGFFLLGMATFFRFQVGLIYIGIMAGFLFLPDRRRTFVTATAVGILLVILQGGVDWLDSREPLSTLMAYLKVNEGGAASYGVHPWYSPILLLLAITYFPFSLSLVATKTRFVQKNGVSLLAFVLFVAAHCAIPHKEERFMYPIAGLLMVYLAYFWAMNWERAAVKWIYNPAFVILNVVILFVACFNNTQSSEIDPIAAIEGRFEKVAIIDIESLLGKSWVRDFYVRPPNTLHRAKIADLEHIGEKLQDSSAVMLITSEPNLKSALSSAAIRGFSSCHDIEQAGSLSDRLVYAMNPKRNQRRRPSWFKICEKGLN